MNNTEEEINTCNCSNGWDMRCCCYPPMVSNYIDLDINEDDLSWFKKEGYEDNWLKCPMKVVNAVQHYKDSRICKYTLKDTIHIPHAKWFFGLMRLTNYEVKEAIEIIKEENKDTLNYEADDEKSEEEIIDFTKVYKDEKGIWKFPLWCNTDKQKQDVFFKWIKIASDDDVKEMIEQGK